MQFALHNKWQSYPTVNGTSEKRQTSAEKSASLDPDGNDYPHRRLLDFNYTATLIGRVFALKVWFSEDMMEEVLGILMIFIILRP